MTPTPDSTTGRAAQIRRDLKARGWTSRQVSVRAKYYSMGSSITVRILDPEIQIATVEQIANAHERVDYDQATGEILSGGNRFVDVSYTGEAFAAVARAIEARLSDEPGKVVQFGRVHVFRDDREPGFWRAIGAREDTRDLKCWGKTYLAQQLATLGLRA